MVNKTTGDFDGGMKQMSAVGGKKGCRARKQERQTRGIAALTLFRTAVPFGGQTTDNWVVCHLKETAVLNRTVKRSILRREKEKIFVIASYKQ